MLYNCFTSNNEKGITQNDTYFSTTPSTFSSESVLGCYGRCFGNFIIYSFTFSYECNGIFQFYCTCGDGVVQASNLEECDDGAFLNGDGCTDGCMLEANSCSLDPKTCSVEFCGDGLKNQSEECDDGGAINGDGCSSECLIESGYSCAQKDLTKPQKCDSCQANNCKECDKYDYDICIECQEFYKLTNDSECISKLDYEVSASTKQMSSGSTAASGIGAGAVIGVSLLNLSSLAAIWSLVNQYQLFILLLLTQTPFPGDVKGMILGNSLMTFNITQYMPVSHIPKMESLMEHVGFEQQNIHLKTVGVNTGSAISNNIGFLLTLALFVCLHPLVLLLKCCINYENDKKCSFNYLMILTVDLFTFTIYVRVCMESFQLLLLTSISELLQTNFGGAAPVISFTSSVLILGVCVGLMTLALYMFWITKDFYDPDRYYKLGEFFSGVRLNKYARLYSFLRCTRRLIVISWLLILHSVSSMILSSGFLVVQVPYFVCLTMLRPFERPENNIVEIINEIIFTMLVIFCVIYDKEQEWTASPTKVFNYIILANSLIITIVMIGALIVTLVQLCKKKCSKPKVNQVKPEVVIQVPSFLRYTNNIESDTSAVRISEYPYQRQSKMRAQKEESKTALKF